MPSSLCEPKCTDLVVFSAALHGESRSEYTGSGAAVRLQERGEMHKPPALRRARVLAAALHDAARRKPTHEGAEALSRSTVVHEARRDQHRLLWHRGQMSLPKCMSYLHLAQRAFLGLTLYASGSSDAQRCG